MAESKRLLVLTRDRDNAAFRQRIEPYLAPLAERGIQTEVVTLANCPWTRRGQMLRATAFDGVLLHRKTLSWLDARHLASVHRLIYDFDDAVMFQARAPQRPHGERQRRFTRTVRLADLVIAGSPILAGHADLAGAWESEVVPTGLDARRFAPKQDYGKAGAARLVWIGSASTLKQLEPIRPALDAIGRAVPGATLRVIADAELRLDGLRVENVPWSYEAEGRLLAECDIGIAPLPDTPYTRGKCGFKVLQYMAAGLPVVTSPVGVNADYVRPEETGLHAATAEEWVAAVRRLAGDPALRERMGCAARELVLREFDFAVLAPEVCDLIERTLV
ncbi:MAG: glycosyltransferase family 4 protein [Planctomycetota bacterium]|nr:glycosyltransferase family 4 protein [Planctomycetota bacterium]